MLVYARDAPRALVLVAASYEPPSAHSSAGGRNAGTALVISTALDGRSTGTGAARAVIEMLPASRVDLAACTRLSMKPAMGCLGLMNVGADLFLAVVSTSVSVGNIRPSENVQRITSVAFYCVNRSTFDETLTGDLLGDAPGPLDPQGYAAPLGGEHMGSHMQQPQVEHPCASLRKLLATGTFYYPARASFDLSSRLDRRYLRRPTKTATAASSHRREEVQHDISSYDGRFVWNSYMMEPMMDFRSRLEPEERRKLDRECFLLLVIQGFVATFEWPSSGLSAAPPSRAGTTLALVSRLSWKRAGTRFNTRGIDDDGNVANFVESETLVTHESVSVSHTQVRGSVPLFWEQQGLQAFNARIQITRPRIASQPAFDRHFAELMSQYRAVHCINLLGTRDAEMVLSAAYAEHVRNSSAELLLESQKPAVHGLAAQPDLGDTDEPLDYDKLGLTNFDFHQTSKLQGGLDGVRNELKYLGPVQLKKKAFLYTVVVDGGENEGVYRRQGGVFRTNCLDCLDRTNVVQDMISQAALESFFDSAAKHNETFEPFRSPAHAVWAHHRVMWAENGDALSKIYAGTGALNTSYTRAGSGKKTIGGFLSDAAKSAGRMYINNFQDKSKQNVIDALLGNMANQRPVSVYDPLHDSVAAELVERLDEYSTTRELSIHTGTWNLAGRGPMGESLLPWLFPHGTSEEPDVFALGFQEVVPLTPQQILMTDPDKIRVWEGIIVNTLSQRPDKKSDYVLLRSEQLVGTALLVLVKESLIGSVRQVEGASKKTGLKGMSGNKGGVAIRLSFFDTTVCFVTAHFAAGTSNVDERNADYWTISRGLAFQRGRTVTSHDHVVWLGDFNYRIDLPNEAVRPLCASGDVAQLYARDQLARARAANAVFTGYEEGVVSFLPTYKYDLNSTLYDSSEKMRVPSWTDRILYRGPRPGALQQTAYGRAELRTSDHRPVYATFRAEARVFDHERRNAIRRTLLSAGKAQSARGGGLLAPAVRLSSDSSDFDEELPEPSSDTHKWWERAGSDSESEDDSSDASSDFGPGDSVSAISGNPFLRPRHVKSRTASPNGAPARRVPPRPPQRGATIRARSSTASSVARDASEPRTAAPPVPPPIPAKPRLDSTDTASTAQAQPAKPTPPAPPPRPGLGSRSTSYSSIHSARSLMDSNSDEEEEKKSLKLGSNMQSLS